MPMSDADLDKIIDGARADLRKAIRNVLEGSSLHLFNIGRQSLPSGQTWDISLTVLSEPIALLMEAIIGKGIPDMTRAYMKATLPPAAAAANTAAHTAPMTKTGS